MRAAKPLVHRRQVSLRPAECDILVVAPVLACGAAAVAPVGLPALLNAGGAVRSVATVGGRTCIVHLRGTGRLLVWADRRPAGVTAGGAAVPFTFDLAACRLDVQVPVDGPLDSVVELTF